MTSYNMTRTVCVIQYLSIMDPNCKLKTERPLIKCVCSPFRISSEIFGVTFNSLRTQFNKLPYFILASSTIWYGPYNALSKPGLSGHKYSIDRNAGTDFLTQVNSATKNFNWHTVSYGSLLVKSQQFNSHATNGERCVEILKTLRVKFLVSSADTNSCNCISFRIVVDDEDCGSKLLLANLYKIFDHHYESKLRLPKLFHRVDLGWFGS